MARASKPVISGLFWFLTFSAAILGLACFFSPTWREIVEDGIAQVWAITGWTMFIAASLLVNIYKHSQKGKTCEQYVAQVRNYFRSPDFYIPAILAYLLLIVCVLMAIPKKILALKDDASTQKTANFRLLNENDSIRKNAPVAKVEVKSTNEDPEARSQVTLLSNRLVTANKELAAANAIIKDIDPRLREIATAVISVSVKGKSLSETKAVSIEGSRALAGLGVGSEELMDSVLKVQQKGGSW